MQLIKKLGNYFGLFRYNNLGFFGFGILSVFIILVFYGFEILKLFGFFPVSDFRLIWVQCLAPWFPKNITKNIDGIYAIKCAIVVGFIAESIKDTKYLRYLSIKYEVNKIKIINYKKNLLCMMMYVIWQSMHYFFSKIDEICKNINII